MPIITSQQIARYFEQYRNIDVTFNKQVIQATGLLTRHVFLKIVDHQWPCIIYSSSLAAAKLVANVKVTFHDQLRKANNRASLRFCFRTPDSTEPIIFHVGANVGNVTTYTPQNPDVVLISIDYTQRPPDDLIAILGTLLEASANFQRRKDERIALTTESLKKMGLESREATLVADGKPRRCILLDLSFGGAKALVPDASHDLLDKTVSLRMIKDRPRTEIAIEGSIRRVEELGDRKDVVSVGIVYGDQPPMMYKLLISSYLATIRKPGADKTEKPAAPTAAGTAAPTAAGAGAAEGAPAQTDAITAPAEASANVEIPEGEPAQEPAQEPASPANAGRKTAEPAAAKKPAPPAAAVAKKAAADRPTPPKRPDPK